MQLRYIYIYIYIYSPSLFFSIFSVQTLVLFGPDSSPRCGVSLETRHSRTSNFYVSIHLFFLPFPCVQTGLIVPCIIYTQSTLAAFTCPKAAKAVVAVTPGSKPVAVEQMALMHIAFCSNNLMDYYKTLRHFCPPYFLSWRLSLSPLPLPRRRGANLRACVDSLRPALFAFPHHFHPKDSPLSPLPNPHTKPSQPPKPAEKLPLRGLSIPSRTTTFSFTLS